MLGQRNRQLAAARTYFRHDTAGMQLENLDQRFDISRIVLGGNDDWDRGGCGEGG
jgi:hypothetical protein